MDNEAPPAGPQEFNVVLESPQLSAEQWARFIRMQRLKQSMRENPTPLKWLTISTSDEPDFFIVERHGKG